MGGREEIGKEDIVSRIKKIEKNKEGWKEEQKEDEKERRDKQCLLHMCSKIS